MKKTLMLVLAGIPLCVLAQATPATSPSSGATGSGDTTNKAPSSPVTFRAEQPVPGFTAPNAIAGPIRCSTDGTAFLNTPLPPDFQNFLVSAISDKGAVGFPIANLPGLENIRFQDFFPSGHSLTYLVTASPNPRVGQSSLGGGQQTAKRGTEYHHYLLQFDRTGVFQKSIQLPDGTQFLRFAILPSGNLVASGFDVANNVPRLMLLNPDGAVLRPLELPSGMEKKAEFDQLQQRLGTAASVAGSQMYSRGLFASQALGVVYSLPGSAAVLSITGDGTVREVNVQAPEGYALDSLVSSDGGWIVQFRRANAPGQGAVDARPESRNFVYFQVDPRDGSLVRELDLRGSKVAWVACQHDNKLIAYKMDENSRLIPMSADIAN